MLALEGLDFDHRFVGGTMVHHRPAIFLDHVVVTLIGDEVPGQHALAIVLMAWIGPGRVRNSRPAVRQRARISFRWRGSLSKAAGIPASRSGGAARDLCSHIIDCFYLQV
jgi:hypothetical protein